MFLSAMQGTLEMEQKKKVLCSTNLVKIIQFQNSKQFWLSCLWMRHNSMQKFCLTANCHPTRPNHTTYIAISNKLLIKGCSGTKTLTKQWELQWQACHILQLWNYQRKTIHQKISNILTMKSSESQINQHVLIRRQINK